MSEIGIDKCAHHINEQQRRIARYYAVTNYWLAITGSQLKFYVVASWPGSVYDNRMFDSIKARVLYEKKEVPGLLLGDIGYTCQPLLFCETRVVQKVLTEWEK